MGRTPNPNRQLGRRYRNVRTVRSARDLATARRGRRLIQSCDASNGSASCTKWIRTALAPAGRIALTNYLGQSAIGLLLFTGIGFGAAGALSPLGTFVVALLVFAAQLAVSAVWLRRYRYGPAEWLLRWITNGRRPAWRVLESRTV
ncbi:DUF418 domain-containing protein [Nocardia colli]|uniref:DUF418 domain-containing protein n=1 Tax=Nocardia colli TaxID=2545717 RepID=UPI0035D5922E